MEFEPDLEIEALRRQNSLPLPVVVEATRIAQRDPSRVDAFVEVIADEMASAGIHKPETSEIESGLKNGRYFVLIDALDEIADSTKRARTLQLLKGIAGVYPLTRVLLTTRSARYTGQLRFAPEFESVEVAPLDNDQVRRLCSNWAVNRQRDDEYTNLLMTAVSGLADKVEGRQGDQALTENPLMLTAICMVFERYRSLPDDRGRLCELLIDDLCRSRRSEDTERGWKLDEAGKKDLLQRIALAMQEQGAQSWPFERAVDIALQLVPTTDDTRRERAKRYVDWASDHTGILRFQEATDQQEQIRFWHRLFREYLSATRLAQEDTTAGEKINSLWIAGRLTDPFWEDVLRLLPRTLGTIEKARSLRDRLEALSRDNPEARGRLLGLAAASIIENRDLFPDVDFQKMANSMSKTYEAESDNWSTNDRLLFLESMGRLDRSGDPRMHVERWIELKPGGAFIVHHSELPKEVELAYGWAPVTVQEFAAFVKSDAFADPRFWDGAPQPAIQVRDGSLRARVLRQARHPNRPVVNVGLFDALAFCRWRSSSRKDGKVIRLPTVHEWNRLQNSSMLVKEQTTLQRPSSGDKSLFNWSGAGIDHPTPVGAFPLRICGACDVIGNVWEFVLPSFTKQELSDDSEPSWPVVGGAYDSPSTAPFRGFIGDALIIDGFPALGFRCVAANSTIEIPEVVAKSISRRKPTSLEKTRAV